MASSDTATRKVSDGVKIDCLRFPFSDIGAVVSSTSSGRPKASSSRFCSDLSRQWHINDVGSPLLDFVQRQIDEVMYLGRNSL
jgi:hypothetical protein